MVEKRTEFTYVCPYCNATYRGSRGEELARDCERECAQILETMRMSPKLEVGTFLYDEENRRILRIRFASSSYVEYYFIKGGEYGLRCSSESVESTEKEIENLCKLELVRERDVPDYLDKLYQSIKDVFLIRSFVTYFEVKSI